MKTSMKKSHNFKLAHLKKKKKRRGGGGGGGRGGGGGGKGKLVSVHLCVRKF